MKQTIILTDQEISDICDTIEGSLSKQHREDYFKLLQTYDLEFTHISEKVENFIRGEVVDYLENTLKQIGFEYRNIKGPVADHYKSNFVDNLMRDFNSLSLLKKMKPFYDLSIRVNTLHSMLSAKYRELFIPRKYFDFEALLRDPKAALKGFAIKNKMPDEVKMIGSLIEATVELKKIAKKERFDIFIRLLQRPEEISVSRVYNLLFAD